MDKLKNVEGPVVQGPKGKKAKQRYPRLGRGQIIPTAQALHRRMYTAFAEYVTPFPLPSPFRWYCLLAAVCGRGKLRKFKISLTGKLK